MSFVNEYLAYFENLAKTHREILHLDEEKHFFRLEPEEYLISLTDDVNYPALMLEGYDVGFGDKETNNIMKYINGGFAVLDHLTEQQDVDAIHEIWDQCEKIGSDILVRIYNEKFTRLGMVLKLDFNNVQMQLVANDANGTYGVRYTFTLMARQPHIVDNTKWTDLDDND
jgi:hypothetical protein